MGFSIMAYSLAKKALKRKIKRSDLEYPTEDVDFFWWVVIGKAKPYEKDYYTQYRTFMSVDDFTDKRIFGYAVQYVWARWLKNTAFDTTEIYYELGTSQRVSPDWADAYMLFVRIYKYNPDYDNPTEVLILDKRLNGDHYRLGYSATQMEYGWDARRRFEFECVGSSLKCFLEVTEVISVTDTDLAAGKIAVFGELPPIPLSSFLVFKPTSRVTKPKIIVELNVVGSGKREDPYRPEIPKELERKIAWSSFDCKAGTPTMLVMVKRASDEDIGKLIEYVKQKGLKVIKPPKNYSEAVEQYRKIRNEFNLLAGKDDYAYQTLGVSDIEYFATTDFYYGNLIEHKHGYEQLKRVVDLEKTLKMWLDRLRKVNILIEERNKHLRKMSEVLRKGW